MGGSENCPKGKGPQGPKTRGSRGRFGRFWPFLANFGQFLPILKSGGSAPVEDNGVWGSVLMKWTLVQDPFWRRWSTIEKCEKFHFSAVWLRAKTMGSRKTFGNFAIFGQILAKFSIFDPKFSFFVSFKPSTRPLGPKTDGGPRGKKIDRFWDCLSQI